MKFFIFFAFWIVKYMCKFYKLPIYQQFVMNNSALWPAWMLIACVGCISHSPNSPSSPGRTTLSWTKLNWTVGKVGLKINLSFWTKTKTQKPQSHSQGGVFVAKLWYKFCDFIFQTVIRDWLTQIDAGRRRPRSSERRSGRPEIN